MIIPEGEPSKIREIIEQHNNFAIFTHTNPDGDTIGATIGTYNMLINMGKKATVISPNAVPNFLKWMNGADQILEYASQAELVNNAIDQADALIFLDFGQFSRTADLEKLLEEQTKPCYLIDHHPDTTIAANAMVVDPLASSASELTFGTYLAAGLDEYIDTNAASAFYSGILTDTGRFNHNSSQPETFENVAKLLRKGINKDDIHDKIFNNNTEDRLRLLGKLLFKNMVLLPEYEAAFIYIPLKDQITFNFKPGDSEGIVNQPLMIGQVKVSALFTEKEDLTKVSLRSKGNYNVSEMAQEYFCGGGHFNASGGRVYKSLRGTIELFKKALAEHNNKMESDK